MPRTSLWVALILAFAELAFAQGHVLVVDDGGGVGVDYDELRPAVDAAADGDIILVKSGIYDSGPIVLDGKSLTIVAEFGDQPELRFLEFRVRNLSSEDSVVIRGLILFGASMSVDDCEGNVWLEDCDLGFFEIDDLAELVVRNSSRVSLTRCKVEGFYGVTLFGIVPPGDGLYVRDSRVAVYDSLILGGSGEGDPHNDKQPGGDGGVVFSGFVFASGSTFQGGPAETKLGGDGLVLRTGIPSVDLLDVTLKGGSGNPPGSPLVVESGSVEVLSGSARHAEIESPKRIGESMTLTFRGAPQDFVLIHHSLDPNSIYLRHLKGVLLVNPFSLKTNTIGVLPPSGEITITVAAPPIGAGIEGIRFHCQPTFLDTSGDVFLGSPSVGVILES